MLCCLVLFCFMFFVLCYVGVCCDVMCRVVFCVVCVVLKELKNRFDDCLERSRVG